MTMAMPMPALANEGSMTFRTGVVLSFPSGKPETKTDLDRRNELVVEHMPLVRAIAASVRRGLPQFVDMDDLVHAGVLGLIDAANKFLAEKQVSFATYAKHRVRGAILDSLRKLDWVSRDGRRQQKRVEASTRELAGELQRNPTEEEIAERMGVDVERLRSILTNLNSAGLISASSRGEDTESPTPDFPDKEELHPDSICGRKQLVGILGEAAKTLPERSQKVIVLLYAKEMTMKQAGEVLGVNESRISQIHKSALRKMGAALRENGIYSSVAV